MKFHLTGSDATSCNMKTCVAVRRLSFFLAGRPHTCSPMRCICHCVPPNLDPQGRQCCCVHLTQESQKVFLWPGLGRRHSSKLRVNEPRVVLENAPRSTSPIPLSHLPRHFPEHFQHEATQGLLVVRLLDVCCCGAGRESATERLSAMPA